MRPDFVLRSLFRAVLSREPSPKEKYQLRSQLLVHGDLEAIARDLLLSEEFTVQILPQLVARSASAYGGKKIFFLHVPKTAGTSVRLALAKAIGLPSINLYSGHHVPPDGAFFWPYLAGHVSAGAIPESHIGFTVFREPRSRLLSRYRQSQFERVGAKPLIPLDGGAIKRRPARQPWQVFAGKGLPEYFYLDSFSSRNPQATNVATMWQIPKNLLRKMPTQEQLAGFELGLSRISVAAWAHDSPALIEAIGDVSGTRLDELPRENVADTRVHLEHIFLCERDQEALEMAARRDQEVIDIAVDQGLIPALDPDEADAIFESTLKRLEYSFD